MSVNLDPGAEEYTMIQNLTLENLYLTDVMDEYDLGPNEHKS